MRPEALLMAQEWLQRAERDLRVATSLIGGAETFTDAAAFYSQQAAEKAFKAFLSAYDHPFPRTHDLDRLLQWCAEIENRFTMFEDPARILTPYAVEFRYPSGRMEPEESEALEAVRLAAGIVAFVSQRLSSIDPEAGT